MKASVGDAVYVVAGTKPWNRRIFDEVISAYPGRWHYLSRPEDLDLSWLASVAPRYIFFLHWSWKVPKEIVAKYECVGFHMTELPYGRGGSPLQHLILAGRRATKLTAFRLAEEVDAGPVYLAEDLGLEGSAEEIYVRASRLSAKMIRRFMEEDLEPKPQAGATATLFKRRKPSQSRIPKVASLEKLYDFIRMLDAEGYPRAFLEYRGFHYEFSRARLHDGRIAAEVTITPAGKGER